MGITSPCIPEGTNATDKRRRDVWNVGMDSSSDRTEDGCSSQKSDSMDRSRTGEKTRPHFLLSPSCPCPPFAADILSLSLPFSDPCDLRANVRRAGHFLVVFGTFGQTRPLNMSHRDSLSKETNVPRENQTRGIDQMRIDPSTSFRCRTFRQRFFLF